MSWTMALARRVMALLFMSKREGVGRPVIFAAVSRVSLVLFEMDGMV